MAEWNDKLINTFSKNIERMKYVRDWNEKMFERVKPFYYTIFAIFQLYVFAIIYLLEQDKRAGDKGLEWSIIDYVCFGMVIVFTCISTSLESIQLFRERLEYFQSPSNFLEAAQIICNYTFIVYRLMG